MSALLQNKPYCDLVFSPVDLQVLMIYLGWHLGYYSASAYDLCSLVFRPVG